MLSHIKKNKTIYYTARVAEPTIFLLVIRSNTACVTKKDLRLISGQYHTACVTEPTIFLLYSYTGR